ncbi:MAG TPA: TetR/AcrR family transcriptional regulator C-terminal domain-containing protein [Burkholderiales bacterium]
MKAQAPPRRQPLSPDRIYRAALAIIDREGVESLSMRRLAAALGVDAMSIYHHVPSKRALMQGIYETVLGELPLPAPDDGAWQEALRALGRRFRALARRYPKVFPHLIASAEATAREIEIYQRLCAILTRAGLSAVDASRATRAIYTYATGLALVAATALCRRRRHQGASAPPDDARSRGEGEQDFAFSIELLIAGIERCLRAPRKAAARTRASGVSS